MISASLTNEGIPHALRTISVVAFLGWQRCQFLFWCRLKSPFSYIHFLNTQQFQNTGSSMDSRRRLNTRKHMRKITITLSFQGISIKDIYSPCSSQEESLENSKRPAGSVNILFAERILRTVTASREGICFSFPHISCGTRVLKKSFITAAARLLTRSWNRSHSSRIPFFHKD